MRIFEPSKAKRPPIIRVINLVDVLFILLIFFIATTTFRATSPTAVKLVLPEAKTAEEGGREKVDGLNIAVGSAERTLTGAPISPPGCAPEARWLTRLRLAEWASLRIGPQPYGRGAARRASLRKRLDQGGAADCSVS